MVAAPSGSKPAQLSSFGETNAWPRPTPCHLARPRIWPSPHRKEAFWSDEKMKESMPGGRKIERIKESGRGNKEKSLLPLFMGVGQAGQHTATAAEKSRHIPGQEYLPLRLGKVERKRYGGGKTKCATHNQEAREKAMGVEDQLSGFKTTVSNSEPELCGNQCKSLEGQVSPFGEKRALNEYYKEESVESTIEKRGSGIHPRSKVSWHGSPPHRYRSGTTSLPESLAPSDTNEIGSSPPHERHPSPCTQLAQFGKQSPSQALNTWHFSLFLHSDLQLSNLQTHLV
nr:hypothetical protein Iba_chr11bCG12330 [Ipomoea batatas]